MSRGGVASHLEEAPDQLTAIAPSGLGPERISEIQRARVLAAMAEISCERGADNVTVADVVERAGVSRRTFYEIFDNRDECFLATFDDAIERARAWVVPAYRSGYGWAERLRLALAALLAFLDVERAAGRLLVVGSLGVGTRALERRTSVLAPIVQIVDEGRREAEHDARIPSLTAEGLVGAVVSIIHARMVEGDSSSASDQVSVTVGPSLGELINPLMSMIVLPYLGAAGARKELEWPLPRSSTQTQRETVDPLRELNMRLTYRTVRVLLAIRARPGASNKEIGAASGARDQGQISKLLARLESLGLIHREGGQATKGAPNAWTLTVKGHEVGSAMSAAGTTEDRR